MKFIEKKFTEVSEIEYKKAKKIIKSLTVNIIGPYQNHILDVLVNLQKKCDHKNFYRHWIDENILANTCRRCFYSWQEKNKDLSSPDSYKLTSGMYEMAEQDKKNIEALRKIIDEIIIFPKK